MKLQHISCLSIMQRFYLLMSQTSMIKSTTLNLTLFTFARCLPVFAADLDST